MPVSLVILTQPGDARPRRVLTVAWLNVVIDLATFYGLWQWALHERPPGPTR